MLYSDSSQNFILNEGSYDYILKLSPGIFWVPKSEIIGDTGEFLHFWNSQRSFFGRVLGSLSEKQKWPLNIIFLRDPITKPSLIIVEIVSN